MTDATVQPLLSQDPVILPGSFQAPGHAPADHFKGPDMTDQRLHPILCRTCDGFLGDCRGNNPGCPVTHRLLSPSMMRILLVYLAVMALVLTGLYLVWSNGNP